MLFISFSSLAYCLLWFSPFLMDLLELFMLENVTFCLIYYRNISQFLKYMLVILT